MSSTKSEKSNLIMKSDELERMPSRNLIRCCDVVILTTSFVFTIVVACCIVVYVDNNQSKDFSDIESIVEKILNERKAKSVDNEEKQGHLIEPHDDESSRSKRAAREYGVPSINEGSVVEFFNPKLRPEIEKNDTETMKKTGLKGAAPRGDSWVWLTSYSRIPFEAIEGFCKKTQEYCPPGPTGSPGQPGQKGVKGDWGPIGPPGDSIKGQKGTQGFRGAKGEHGQRGLDGRDGIPGEPGIDGIPGRAGTDGKDGTNGIDGMKGDRGKDGKDGTPGIGIQGPRGPKGEKGLSGPEGKKGKGGNDGLNGSPATCLYGLKRDNESIPYDFWLPPQIPIALPSLKKVRTIIVNEEDNLRLQCAATGQPPPVIVWEREDGKPIDWGKWKDNSKVGQSINITKINRVHMGSYICIADNAVPPKATYRFDVEVHFKPIVRIKHKFNQNLQADYTGSVTFKCESEGFPEPILYWERDGVTLLNDSMKHRIHTHNINTHTFNSSLTINNISGMDYGEYNCMSKNTMGVARMSFYLLTRGQVRPSYDDKAVASGEVPQVFMYEDICPPPEDCPNCPEQKDLKCKDASLSLKDLTGGKELEIYPSGNETYAPMPNRTQDCVLNMVGKPVFHHEHEKMNYGAWLRDPIQKDNITVEKIWLTKELETTNLYEFKNRMDYRKNKPSRMHPYRLSCPFKGNAHIVYNANFYYFCADGAKIVRYDLKTERVAATKAIENINVTQYLYTTNYNVIDFNADDNGLWIIHATPDSNHTIVSKINETSLEIMNSFNISVHHHQVGEMFIVCGVLYAIDSASARETKIRFALDLYTSKLLEVEIPFSNPFNETTSIGYNHNIKDLYAWNRGNQLTYPVRIISMGENQTAPLSFKDAYKKTVGYSVFRNYQNNET